MLKISDDIKSEIVDAFKELIIEKPFEKITIKMITKKVGINRPRFYNYFQDKYDIIEYTLTVELLSPAENLFKLDMKEAAIEMVFNYFYQNNQFYKELLKVEGPNSFDDILQEKIYEFYFNALQQYEFKDKEILNIISMEEITKFYSMGLVIIIKACIEHGFDEEYTVEKAKEVYEFITAHSILDLLAEEPEI